MTRKKVKLAYIANDSARKATFKKRKKGLLKKVKELTTLCDVEACAVIYSPYEASPEVYPSPLGAQRVLGRFRKMPEMEQSKKMVNQEGFLRQRIAKASDQLKKLRKENKDKDVARLMFRALTTPAPTRSLATLSLPDLGDLSSMVDRTLAEVQARLRAISVDNDDGPGELEPQQAPALTLAPAQVVGFPQAAPKEEQIYEGDDDDDDGMAALAKKPQWFMDLIMSHTREENVVLNNFATFETGSGSGSGSGTAHWGNARVFP